jgi:DNA polymerase
MDKLTIEGRLPLFRIQLPSGRYLHYLDAEIQSVKMPWKDRVTGEDVHRPGFTYYGMDQDTKQWTLIVSHGGKLFENIVQGIARDVLADKLLEFERQGISVVAHVHDEGVCEVVDDDFSPTVEDMIEIMSTPVPWALTLPLGADGFQGKFYHK